MMSALAQTISEIVRRNVTDLRFTTLQDAADYIAIRVLADPDIAQGLRDTQTLAAIDARHQPRTWGVDGAVQVCAACQTAWPCTDRQILDGTTEQAPAVTR